MSDEPVNSEEGLWKSAGAQDQPAAHPAESLGQPEHAIGGDGDQVEPSAEGEIWVGRTHWKHFAGRLAG
jgi:hypothetical protein